MTVSNVQSGVIEITGTLSINNYLQLSCVLKLGKPGNFLRMKTKRNDKKKGEGIASLVLSTSRRAKVCWLLVEMKIQNLSFHIDFIP